MIFALLLAVPAASAQDVASLEPSVWDLELGLHAAELPSDRFVDFACGTNGGPPSRVIGGWLDYVLCSPDADTGWHEVYFQYDDELEYIARARQDAMGAALYEHTSVYSRPVIASALFDDDGFMRGLRLVTDPRLGESIRSEAYTLGGIIVARYDGDWGCQDLPLREGEIPYRGLLIKTRCDLTDAAVGVHRMVETHLYRRPGQAVLDPNNVPTEGFFESQTRVEEFLIQGVENRDARLAEVAALPPPVLDPDVARARDCAGCDLAGADLKRADLRGANLEGANLDGANLHGANLQGANLAGASLVGANLNTATLTQIDLAGADLSGAMLYEARLDGSNLSGATMVGMLAGRARMIRADLTNVLAHDSDFTAVRMTSAIATGANFARSRFWNAELSGSDFTDAIFARSDMLNAVMTAATAIGADFRITDLLGADLRDTDFTAADFSGARMTQAILARARVEGALFTDTILPAGFDPPQ